MKPTKEQWEQLIKLPIMITRLDERLLKVQQNLRQAKLKIEKLEKMSVVIRSCNIQITKFNSRHLKVMRVAERNELKMQEIIKDYDSLFKKWGTTITFYERREKGKDWIPGAPADEDEYKIKRSDAGPKKRMAGHHAQ